MICPNCGTHNTDEALVCASCGINFEEYLNSLEKLKSLKNELVRKKVIDATFKSPNLKTKEINEQNKIFWKQVKIILVAGIVFALIISGTAIIIKNWQEYRANQMDHYVLESQTCRINQDYGCALENLDQALKFGLGSKDFNGYLASIHEGWAFKYFLDKNFKNALEETELCLLAEKNHENCLDIYCTSTMEVTKRLVDAGEWRSAIENLDKVILKCRDINSAKSFQNEIYRRWVQEEKAKNNFLQAAKIRLEWEARYPGN